MTCVKSTPEKPGTVLKQHTMTANHINTLDGLTTAQAAQKLLQDGPNDIEQAKVRPIWRRLIDMLRQPMFALLVTAALLYIVLGDLTEGLTLSVFVLAVLVLTFYQEGKSEKSIQALRQLTQANAQVVRSGQTLKIPAREVVVGDWLLISEGDRVAADGQLLSANNLQIDESMLTGESVPVSKQAHTSDTPANSQNTVQAGTFIVRGQGVARVTATGQRSQVGQIGQSLNQLMVDTTPLQQQTASLVKVLASIVLVLCLVMVLTLGWRTGQWIPAVLSGIALAMATLPEEYAVVLTIFPAMGAHRLTRTGVLTRRIQAIETLGAISVLCTDKTGTLTQNRMTVTALAVKTHNAAADASLLTWHAGAPTLSEDFYPLVEHAILASAPEPFDPMEAAFHALGQKHLAATDHLHADWELVQTYALSPQLKAMSHVWQMNDGPDRTVSAKGAPEAMMALCHLQDAERKTWSAQVERMAAQGLRVLAVAQSRFVGNDWPESVHGFHFEWLGLIGLTDPLRPEIHQAVAECQSAGIRVIMITGDYPATAQVIARQAGLPEGETLSGDTLDSLSDPQLQARLAQVTVCARISPHQKLRIALVPMLMGWPPMMLPLHVALMEMVIDPACSIAFENEPADAQVMQRPPRDTTAPLFGASAIALAMGQGLCVLASVALTYFLAQKGLGAWASDGVAQLGWSPLDPAQTRAMVFVTLVVGNAALILSNRAQGGAFWASLRVPNPTAYAVMGLALGFLMVAIYWPWLAGPLQFKAPPAQALWVAIGSGLLSLVNVTLLQWAFATKHETALQRPDSQ
eukprot:gene7794-9302_t